MIFLEMHFGWLVLCFLFLWYIFFVNMHLALNWCFVIEQ